MMRRVMNEVQSPTTGAAADNDIYANPPDVTELELEPGHPGLGDEGYIARRQELFALCREHRLKQLGPPLITYPAEEQRIWREVSPKLDELHAAHASRIYLEAKRELGISGQEIPQLRHLSTHLERVSGMHLVPAEGPIPYRTFYSYIAERGFPVTQFIRHGSKPEFTPEPPKPPITANARSTSGCVLTNASARLKSRTVSPRSDPTAVVSRASTRLWSCDGVNSFGSLANVPIEPAKTTSASRSTRIGWRSPRVSMRP